NLRVRNFSVLNFRVGNLLLLAAVCGGDFGCETIQLPEARSHHLAEDLAQGSFGDAVQFLGEFVAIRRGRASDSDGPCWLRVDRWRWRGIAERQRLRFNQWQRRGF